jgi:uridine kinase
VRRDEDSGERCADVVLLVGPSGSGKTYLAKSVGLPVVALDDFYRADTDPGMPRTADGLVDWESPFSWDAAAAVAALERFCCGDHVDVPDYSISENRAVGTKRLERGGARVVVAEGIFAAELIEPLRADGLLADAVLVHQNRWVTFARRLLRDMREGRKGRWYLVRQGWAKTRSEPAVVARQLAKGARPMSKPDARARLTELAARPAIGPDASPATARAGTTPVPDRVTDDALTIDVREIDIREVEAHPVDTGPAASA